MYTVSKRKVFSECVITKKRGGGRDYKRCRLTISRNIFVLSQALLYNIITNAHSLFKCFSFINNRSSIFRERYYMKINGCDAGCACDTKAMALTFGVLC